jgi:hypothetical protein
LTPSAPIPLSLNALHACNRPDRDALLSSIHSLVEKAGVVREGWNGFNVIHDNASRVAALDIGFAPRCVRVLQLVAC